MTQQVRDWMALRNFLAAELKKQFGGCDRYDPDFILGTIQEFLHKNNMALTGSNVRRFKR